MSNDAQTRHAGEQADPFDLRRFVSAQRDSYAQALAELRQGRKRSHWIWYIFPQLRGLGQSAMSNRYGIASEKEARAYLNHPVLGPRLVECAELVLKANKPSISDIFPDPDDLKFHSSMTLFAQVQPDPNIFKAALEKYFNGEPDRETVRLLGLESK
ncbi:MAG: DUF1810 domain-containing protein [Rhodomicrobium sp.]